MPADFPRIDAILADGSPADDGERDDVVTLSRRARADGLSSWLPRCRDRRSWRSTSCGMPCSTSASRAPGWNTMRALRHREVSGTRRSKQCRRRPCGGKPAHRQARHRYVQAGGMSTNVYRSKCWQPGKSLAANAFGLERRRHSHFCSRISINGFAAGNAPARVPDGFRDVTGVVARAAANRRDTGHDRRRLWPGNDRNTSKPSRT